MSRLQLKVDHIDIVRVTEAADFNYYPFSFFSSLPSDCQVTDKTGESQFEPFFYDVRCIIHQVGRGKNHFSALTSSKHRKPNGIIALQAQKTFSIPWWSGNISVEAEHLPD